MHKDTYVIVPVYNEAEVIGGVLKELKKYFKNIVCVTDGSKDGSGEIIKKNGVQLVAHAFNLGQGAALQTGIDFVLKDPSIEYFVTFDGDGQHDMSDVFGMLETLKERKLDIVLGSRFLGKTEQMPKLKKLILKLAIRFSNKTSGMKLTDAHNGLRVFNRNFAKKLNLQNSDMAHASEITEKIARGKFKYQEFPVTISYTDYSRAKGQSMANVVNLGFDILLNKIIK